VQGCIYDDEFWVERGGPQLSYHRGRHAENHCNLAIKLDLTTVTKRKLSQSNSNHTQKFTAAAAAACRKNDLWAAIFSTMMDVFMTWAAACMARSLLSSSITNILSHHTFLELGSNHVVVSASQ
jgi:hypothetical protein